MVGAAASGVNADDLGGGYSISQIYKRSLSISSETLEDAATTLMPWACRACTGEQRPGQLFERLLLVWTTCTTRIALARQLFRVRGNFGPGEYSRLKRFPHGTFVATHPHRRCGCWHGCNQMDCGRAVPSKCAQDRTTGLFPRALACLYIRGSPAGLLHCLLHDDILDNFSVHLGWFNRGEGHCRGHFSHFPPWYAGCRKLCHFLLASLGEICAVGGQAQNRAQEARFSSVVWVDPRL